MAHLPNSDPSTTTWRIGCLGATPIGAGAVAAAVSSLLPDAEVDVVDLGATSGAPDADLFVIDAASDAALGLEQLVMLRGRGAGGPAIVVGTDDASVPASLGDGWRVSPAELAAALPNALEAIAGRENAATAHPGLAGLLRGLAEMRQLIAAGRIARRVKHDISNPLAALLAEAQLLELEDLPLDTRESVSRIIELTRRVVDEARSLEGPRDGVSS